MRVTWRDVAPKFFSHCEFDVTWGTIAQIWCFCTKAKAIDFLPKQNWIRGYTKTDEVAISVFLRYHEGLPICTHLVALARPRPRLHLRPDMTWRVRCVVKGPGKNEDHYVWRKHIFSYIEKFKFSKIRLRCLQMKLFKCLDQGSPRFGAGGALLSNVFSRVLFWNNLYWYYRLKSR